MKTPGASRAQMKLCLGILQDNLLASSGIQVFARRFEQIYTTIYDGLITHISLLCEERPIDSETS